MKFFGKRAQIPSGGSAAVTVIVIAAMIVLYILFLPQSERDDLLGTNSGKTGTTTNALQGSILLAEHPGTLVNAEEKEFEHAIASINLFTKKEDATLKSISSLHTESSRGSQQAKSVMLPVNDKVENAKLTFSVAQHSGILIITQNDVEIFRGEVDNFIEPISLSLESENLFQFSTETVPWWKPFTKNYYDINDIKIIGTVERLDNKEALQTIMISPDEAELLSEATLSYSVDCSVNDVGRLLIYMNNRLLASKVPDCGSAEKLQIDPEDIFAGKNEMRFVAETGTYLLDRLTLRTKLKEPIFPLYFFSTNSSVYSRISNNTINATLIMRFPDDNERKVASIEINNQKTRMDTAAKNFSKNIDSFIKEGTNYVRLIPETTLNIIDFRIELDCKTNEQCS